MQAELDNYLQYICDDYRGRTNIEDMVKRFCYSVKAIEGKKYIKVTTGNSVHSFIVKADHGKFKRGDILKAATYAAPAKNFARGNILTGTYPNVRWTGA